MALSGQKTVTAAGTAVALGDQTLSGPVMVKALDTNTGVVAVGKNDAGVVSLSTGMRLEAGEVIIFNSVRHLGSLMVDAAVNGEGVSWLALDI
jgi:hypothetical protein